MSTNFNELNTVKNLIATYFDAVYSSDITALKTIFHPNASMNGFLGSDMLVGTPEPFYADLLSKPSMAQQKIECSYVLANIDVSGNIASASILVDNFFGVATVKDNFHLLKDNGKWYIICKTFTTL